MGHYDSQPHLYPVVGFASRPELTTRSLNETQWSTISPVCAHELIELGNIALRMTCHFKISIDLLKHFSDMDVKDWAGVGQFF